MKARTQSKSPSFKKQIEHDPTNQCCCPCQQQLQKVLDSKCQRTGSQQLLLTPKSNDFYKKKETSNRTFLQRSPQRMDPDISTALLKSEVKSLMDEISYWKSRAFQNETDNLDILYVENLKMENDKWKKKYMELQNQYKINQNQNIIQQSTKLGYSKLNRTYNPFENDELQKEHEKVQVENQLTQNERNQLKKEIVKYRDLYNQLKGELQQNLSDYQSSMNQVYVLQQECDNNKQVCNQIKDSKNEIIDQLQQQLSKNKWDQSQIEQQLFNIQELLIDLQTENQSLQNQLDNNHVQFQDQFQNEFDREIISPSKLVHQEPPHTPKEEQNFDDTNNNQQILLLLKHQIFQQQSYIDQLIDEIEVWKTKVMEISKQKSIELRLKDEDYNYNLDQKTINYKHQILALEFQLSSLKKILDSKIQENEELRKSNNSMAVKCNEASLIQQRLIAELGGLRFNTQNSLYMQASPERSYILDSPQNNQIFQDNLNYRF